MWGEAEAAEGKEEMKDANEKIYRKINFLRARMSLKTLFIVNLDRETLAGLSQALDSSLIDLMGKYLIQHEIPSWIIG